jgi:hypothetical protein
MVKGPRSIEVTPEMVDPFARCLELHAEQLTEVIEDMTALMIRMRPIYLGPKQKLVAKIKELQQKNPPDALAVTKGK